MQHTCETKCKTKTKTPPTTTVGYPVVNDPLYNHEVFGPTKGRGGDIGGKTDEQLVRDLINIHNAENWLGIDGDSELSLFKPMKGGAEGGVGGSSTGGDGGCSVGGGSSGSGNGGDSDDGLGVLVGKGKCSHNYLPFYYFYTWRNMYSIIIHMQLCTTYSIYSAARIMYDTFEYIIWYAS